MSKKKRNRPSSPSSVSRPPVPNGVQAQPHATPRSVRLESRHITVGPIPSADELRRYKDIQSDFPERIMRQFERRTEMAEEQARHRMALERRVIGNNIWMERLG